MLEKLIIKTMSVTIKLWGRCRSDPWFVIRFIIITITLGAIGKLMLIGSVEGAEAPKWAAQFMPTVPMMLLTFLVHRYLWDHKRTSLWSHVGGHWSKSYLGQFIAGHSLFTFFAVYLGWKYWAVSAVIGALSAGVTFALNELKIFVRRRELEAVKGVSTG